MLTKKNTITKLNIKDKKNENLLNDFNLVFFFFLNLFIGNVTADYGAGFVVFRGY